MSEKTTLANLAAREDALVARLREVGNEPDQAVYKLVHAEVSQCYRYLYHDYVHLLQTTPKAATRLEVLKRTVFLCWHALAEPDWYTGIGCLAPSDTGCVLGVLDAVIGQNQLDEEFSWMLAYYATWDFALQPIPGEGNSWPALAAFVQEKTVLAQNPQLQASSIPIYVDPNSVIGRGQLSAYWLSIINR